MLDLFDEVTQGVARTAKKGWKHTRKRTKRLGQTVLDAAKEVPNECLRLNRRITHGAYEATRSVARAVKKDFERDPLKYVAIAATLVTAGKAQGNKPAPRKVR